MKIRTILFLWLAVSLFLALAWLAHAQSPDAAMPAAGPDFTNAVTSLAAKAPWIFTALAAIGALRLLIKPFFAAAHFFAERTETPKDDELIAKIENSKALRTFCFVLDWIASVKIVRK